MSAASIRFLWIQRNDLKEIASIAKEEFEL